jgi:hypothetical protein
MLRRLLGVEDRPVDVGLSSERLPSFDRGIPVGFDVFGLSCRRPGCCACSEFTDRWTVRPLGLPVSRLEEARSRSEIHSVLPSALDPDRVYPSYFDFSTVYLQFSRRSLPNGKLKQNVGVGQGKFGSPRAANGLTKLAWKICQAISDFEI